MQVLSKRIGIVVIMRHMSSQCPKKKVHAVEDMTTVSQVGNQDTTMVGAIGRYFDLDSVSEGILEPRGAGAKIRSVGSPMCVCDGVNAGIEIGSGAGRELSSGEHWC